MMMAMKGSIFAAALGVACLLPATTHAQAEVSARYLQRCQHRDDCGRAAPDGGQYREGCKLPEQFALPYEVRCKGKSLKLGQYSLSAKSEGTTRIVTLARNGETMNIPAQELTVNPKTSHSTVLVRKSQEGRMLEAVYVLRLNLLLFLDGNAATQSGQMERLPIT